MHNSSDLFELIKSLSGSEKRYFKLFASLQKGDKNYLKLFDAIAEQKEYDEKEIKKKFAKEKFARQLTRIKNYLYGIVLKCLEQYDNGIDSELKKLSRQIEVLYRKRLYKQCLKIIARAKKIGYKHEHFPFLLEITEWETKIISQDPYGGKFKQSLQEILKEKRNIIELVRNNNDYHELSAQSLKILHIQGVSRNEDSIAAFNHLLDNALLKDESKAMTFKSKMFFYEVLALCARGKGDSTNGYIYRDKIVQLTEMNPEKGPGYNYIIALFNLLIGQLEVKKYRQFTSTIQKLKNMFKNELNTLSEDTQALLFKSIYPLELNMYMQTQQFEKAISIIPQFKDGLRRYEEKMRTMDKIGCYYDFTCLYFYCGDYKEALVWSNKMLNYPHLEFRQDLLCFARIINLMLHFELQNFDLLEYIVKSTYRFLHKRGGLYKFETCVLNFIRKKFPKINDNKELLEAFKELKTELEKITRDPFEKLALEYFDFISWIDSKIQNRQLTDVVTLRSAE